MGKVQVMFEIEDVLLDAVATAAQLRCQSEADFIRTAVSRHLDLENATRAASSVSKRATLIARESHRACLAAPRFRPYQVPQDPGQDQPNPVQRMARRAL